MTNKTPAIAEVSEIVRKLCEEKKVALKSNPHIPSNASCEACLAYAGFYYTCNGDFSFLRDKQRSRLWREYGVNLENRFNRMARALRADGLELDKSLLIDIGCGPGLFLHAAHANANAQDIVLYGYDHSKQMLKLAEEIWKGRKLTPEASFIQTYEEVTETAKNHLQSQPKHLIFTFGYVWVQVAQSRSKSEEAWNDFVKQTAASIALLTEHAQSCTILAIDSWSEAGSKEAFTEVLNQIKAESQLEWDIKWPYDEAGISVICTVRKSNE